MLPIMRIRLLLALLLLSIACMQNKVNVLELEAKEIVTNLSDSSYLINVIDIQVKENVLYLVDSEANRIITLDTLNHVIKTFGRYGAGPGEFNGTSNIQFFKDSLFIVSSVNKTMNIFDLEGNFIRMVHLPPQIFGSTKFIIDNNENFYFSTPTDMNFPILKVDAEGKIVQGFGEWNPYSNNKEKLTKNIKNLIRYEDKIIAFTHGSTQIEIFSFEGRLLEIFSINENYFVAKRLAFAEKEISTSSLNKTKTYELIKDASLDDENLFLLIYDYDKSVGSGCNKILRINIHDKRIITTYVLKSNDWYRSFALYKNKLYAFAGSRSSESQIFILSE